MDLLYLQRLLFQRPMELHCPPPLAPLAKQAETHYTNRQLVVALAQECLLARMLTENEHWKHPRLPFDHSKSSVDLVA